MLLQTDLVSWFRRIASPWL